MPNVNNISRGSYKIAKLSKIELKPFYCRPHKVCRKPFFEAFRQKEKTLALFLRQLPAIFPTVKNIRF